MSDGSSGGGHAAHHWHARWLVPPVVAVLVLLSLSAFYYLPDGACSEPVCARDRFSVFLEVDAFGQVEPIAFELDTAEGPVSPASVLRSGGVDVEMVVDQMDLPYAPSAGRLDRADLYQFAQTWRNRTPPAGANAQLYAMLAPGIVSDTGENLFGLMFDYQGREGFAVAPREIARAFGAQNGSVPLLQLRTFIHEMLHALNRRHMDAAQMPDGRLTIEAPTKCIADLQSASWTLKEPPLFALSPYTINFFQTAAATEVLPGRGNSPFVLRRASARECDEARANLADAPASSRWEYTARRIGRLLGIAVARAQEVPAVHEPVDASLQLEAVPAAYPLGYPVAVRVIAENTGEKPLPLKERLQPGFGLVWIDIRETGTEQWRSLRPLAWYEPANDDSAMLSSGERTEATVPVYFGEDGWSFPVPGTYEMRARLHLGDDFPDISSNTITLGVVAPRTERDRAALEPLLDGEGELDAHIGRLMAFDGRIGAADNLQPIEHVATQFTDTALGSALSLTVASHLLRPPIDTRTGTRPEPDIARARQLLTDVCPDSGVAALRAQLLGRYEGVQPAEGRTAGQAAAVAWSGTLSSGQAAMTYADPNLNALDAQIEFGLNEAYLREPALESVRQLARDLRQKPGTRIVVVGHADAHGGCRHNERLALQRAQAVRRALISLGIRASRIEAVTLGERRPLDFATDEVAYARNRRVEVLVEAEAEDSNG